MSRNCTWRRWNASTVWACSSTIPSACQALAAAGARVEGNHVFIPPHIIQETLALAPKTFTLWGRDGEHHLQVATDRVYFGPGPTCTYFYDPETGERRKARRGDAAMTARVCDALANIDFAMSLSLFDDVPPMLSPVYEFAEMIANTGKPVVAWATDPATLDDIYRIAAAVAGREVALRRKPFFAYFANYESPLRHGEKQIANMIWAAEHGIPIVYLGGPTVGLESPVTGASALVLYLAAALSGLAIVQLKRRGAPMVIGGLPSAMDLRTARPGLWLAGNVPAHRRRGRAGTLPGRAVHGHCRRFGEQAAGCPGGGRDRHPDLLAPL